MSSLILHSNINYFANKKGTLYKVPQYIMLCIYVVGTSCVPASLVISLSDCGVFDVFFISESSFGKPSTSVGAGSISSANFGVSVSFPEALVLLISGFT